MIPTVQASYEQSIACVACLDSALWVFSPACADDQRNLRVLRGLHGFQLYAHEYWIDHLLISASHHQTFQYGESKVLVNTLERLGQNAASKSVSLPESAGPSKLTSTLHKRLDALKIIPSIYDLAKVEMENRALSKAPLDSDYGTIVGMQAFH